MRCFVIMPFGDPQADPEQARKLDQIYTNWIKPAVESVEIPGSPGRVVCHRADKEMRPGDAIAHIIEQLVDSEIVIADLTGRRPNVFYELGVRHAVNNNTILIAEDAEDVPFDLRGLRTIIYRYDPESMLKLRDSLSSMIRNILVDGGRIDNPVRTFLYNREMHRLIHAPNPPGFDAVNELISEFAAVRKELADQQRSVRAMLGAITARSSRQELDATQRFPLALSGVWRSSEGSTYCIKRIHGEIRVAYCYQGDSSLTSHVYNCRVAENVLTGRFRWFEAPIEGFIYVQMVAPGVLAGGWWYKDDFPFDELSGPPKSRMDRMNAIRLSRIEKRHPAWAKQYFADVERGAVT
jgi:hypothetical protein